MVLSKDKKELQNFSEAASLEWLETNGLGGWAGSSLCGCNTRRYHGLLMAAINDPANRILLVSRLDETLLLNGESFELATNNYGDTVSPDGYRWLESFQKNIFSEWIFSVPGIRLRKTIGMVHGENTTLIRYEILDASGPFILQLLPLVAARGYHALQHAPADIHWDVNFKNGLFHNIPFAGAPDIYISVPGSTYQSVNKWYYHFNYQEEKNRGFDYTEDLFNHGILSVNLKQGDILHVILSTKNSCTWDAAALFEQEAERKRALCGPLENDLVQQLILAADQFIVNRDMVSPSDSGLPQSLKTVIAGYHWFTDWGRDTMISLPGLCLSTGRAADAKKIISAFGHSVSMGMLPNRFRDNNETPEYNNVDATLWYFNAVYAYLEFTGDRSFILNEILPVLKDIIGWHFKGTRFNIHSDRDDLLSAGESGQQLTWMDAKVGSFVVTPRMGKPVEIEALWFNALQIFGHLLILNGETDAASAIQTKAEHARESFNQTFWFASGNYCYDVIDENGNPDKSLRPNQLLAISLPFPLLQGVRAKQVWEVLRLKLYTPFGLRSLSPDDPLYRGRYEGDAFTRDSAYHQGTAWSWLLGPFVEAGMQLFGESFRQEAENMIGRFATHLNEAGIGTVSEIFDGDYPHQPRGCIAQAWGVAEILRVVKTYSLVHAAS